MSIKAVLFDMDWVLIDARERHYEALNRALELFGYTITREEHEWYYNGLPTLVKLQRLTEEKWLPLSLHQFINEMKQQYTVDEIYNNSKPDFWKQVMLKKLKNMWIKVACCSNSIRKSIEMMLDKALILDYFDLIVSNQDITKAKPDPEMYLKAIDTFWLKPDEVIIVEDSPHGIEAAKKTWWHLIVVNNAAETHWWIFWEYF